MRLKMTQKQIREAQQALDTAALNGTVYLAMLLRRHAVITVAEAEQLHAMMSKPFNLEENASNPLVQATQHHLDEQFSTIVEQQ